MKIATKVEAKQFRPYTIELTFETPTDSSDFADLLFHGYKTDSIRSRRYITAHQIIDVMNAA